MASLASDGLNVLVLSNNPNSEHHDKKANEKYLPQFYKLRFSVFSENGRKSLVGDQPDHYDNHKDSYAIVLLDSVGKVLGGRKISVHEPNSGTELSTDKRIVGHKNEFIPIRETLSHLDVEGRRYALFSGMCFDKTIRGKGYSNEFNTATYDLVKELKCEFSATQLHPPNFVRMTKSALENGARQVLARPDQRAMVGTFRTFISFLDEDQLPLQSPEQRENGIGLRVTLSYLQIVANDWNSLFPDHYRY